jgi:hypothetical protein
MIAPMQQFDFGTTALLVDEAHSRAAIFALSEPGDDISGTGTELDGNPQGWLIALTELRLHHPDAVLDPEPEYDSGVEIFTARW